MIRPADRNDETAIARLVAELASRAPTEDLRTRFIRVLEHPEHRVWVFERAGSVAGFVHAFIRPALEKPLEVVVQSIVTDGTVRKEGIGRKLMEEVERWAADSGYTSVALHTRNAAAFYRRLGYDEIAAPSFMRKVLR